MFYPDNETGIDVMPEIAPKQSDTVKWFTKGGKGIAPTVPGQDTWNIWQAELLNILNLAGIKPDKTKLDQIAQAIKLIAGAVVDNKIGDGDYLEVSKNLEEIYEQGLEAQVEARGHIGITGDIAYRDEYNFFSENARWGDGVNTSVMLRIIRYRLTDVGYLQGVATTCLKLHSVGKLQLSVADVNSLICLVGSNEYRVYHEGNLTPVLSVNNAKPDAAGNVKVSTGSTVDLSNYYTKAEVNALLKPADAGAVGSYALLTISGESLYQWSVDNGYVNANNPPPTRVGNIITGTIFQTARIAVGGDGTSTTSIVSTGAVSGNWMLLGSLAETLVTIERFKTLCVLAVRVS
ncbi:hypothetical protein ACSN1S_003134 [Salmonella enterica subsp. enterica]